MEKLTTSLPYRQPKYPSELWVFGSKNQCFRNLPSSASASQPDSIPQTLSDKITYALCKYVIGPQDNILIQFWVPTTFIGGRCVLTTVDQPYGLSSLHTGLCSYRERSLTHFFEAEAEAEAEDKVLGLPGRVFQYKVLESTPDVRFYSSKEYPQRDFAVGCDIRGSLAFPIFDPCGQSCVGVLEIVGTADDLHLEYIKARYVIAEVAHLKLPFKHNLFDNNVLSVLHSAADEIHEVLGVVCKTHQLPLAQSWVPWNYTNDATYEGNLESICDISDLSSSKDVTVVAINAAYDRLNSSWLDYKWACGEYYMTKRHWLVGKSFQSQKPCFCRDISQFSITEYPFSHYARSCGLTGCFTICLHSSFTGNKDYVLEFFLPWQKLGIEDPRILLDSILETMKQHFRSFKVASGEELGEELLVQVIKFSMNDEPDTLKICQTTRSPPRPQALEKDGEAVPTDSSHKQLMGEGGIQHERFVFGAEKGNIASSSSLENTFIMQRPERDQRKTENGIAYKDLQHHFGIRTLSEAAEILEVSRSTLKRICRTYGILRWPSVRRNKLNGLPLPSNLRRGIEFPRLVEQPVPGSSRGEPVCSDIPPLQVPTSVAHTIPDNSVMQDVNNMTIKATYNGLVIKFQLSSSAGMAELEEKVIQRLKLKEGTFIIQYPDDEGEWILIACDEDVQECMGSSRSLKKTTIKMLIEQAITN